MYSSQMLGRSCFFRYNSESSGAWEPCDGLTMDLIPLKNLEPRFLVLPFAATSCPVPCPQNIATFSMSLEMLSTSNPLNMMMTLEATQSGVAVPIKAASLSRNVQPEQLSPQEFDISAGFSLSTSTGRNFIEFDRVQKFEVQVDLSRASPGLLVFNLWSSTDKPQVPMLLATGRTLLLPKGLEQVSEELNHAAYAYGENLLADLADILAVNAPATKSSHLSRLNPSDTVLCRRQLLISAKDILKWSREAGLHHLERLASIHAVFLELPELMPIPLSAWWSGWWTFHSLFFAAAWNYFRGITG